MNPIEVYKRFMRGESLAAIESRAMREARTKRDSMFAGKVIAYPEQDTAHETLWAEHKLREFLQPLDKPVIAHKQKKKT